MRSVGYAPMYFLISEGFFEREGLNVVVKSARSPAEASRWVLDGTADMAWGGPIRIMMHHDRDPRCPLVCFGGIVARDPFVLIGRQRKEAFGFSNLIGLRVAVAADVPTAWLTFQDDLARAGIDPASIERLSAPSMRENVDRFLAGEVDVVQVFEPFAEGITSAGQGHEWHRFSRRGEICYTSLYTTRGFADQHPTACRSMLRALAHAQAAFDEADPISIATSIASFFPGLGADRLALMIAAYRIEKLWPSTPRLSLTSFLKLKAAAVSGEFIATDVPYERVVAVELNGSLDLDR